MRQGFGREHYKVGFTGAILDELVDVLMDKVEYLPMPITSVLVPFAGSGKAIAALARENRIVRSFDIQELSSTLIWGLTQQSAPSTLLEPKGRMGYARMDFPLKDLDEGCARVLNYIAARGDVHDKAALVKAMFRCSALGRPGIWANSVEDYHHFWRTWQKCREYVEGWSGLPGIIHTKGDFFLCSDSAVLRGTRYDLLFVDPPKVVGASDVYSIRGFLALNSILEQREVVWPGEPWTWKTYLAQMERVLGSVRWRALAFVYSSGLVPTLQEILELVPQPCQVTEFPRGGRSDFLIWATR